MAREKPDSYYFTPIEGTSLAMCRECGATIPASDRQYLAHLDSGCGKAIARHERYKRERVEEVKEKMEREIREHAERNIIGHSNCRSVDPLGEVIGTTDAGGIVRIGPGEEQVTPTEPEMPEIEIRPGCVLVMGGWSPRVVEDYDEVKERLDEAGPHELIEFTMIAEFSTTNRKALMRQSIARHLIVGVQEITDEIEELRRGDQRGRFLG